MKKIGGSECAVSHHVLTGSGPAYQRAIAEQGLAHLPLKITVTDHFKVTAHVESRGKPSNQSINGDGRTDVLDYVSFGPDARRAREPEHIHHHHGKVLAQSSPLPAHFVPAISHPLQAVTKLLHI